MIDFFDDYILNDDELLAELIEKAHKEIKFNDDLSDEEAEELARQLQTLNIFEQEETKFKIDDLDKELERVKKEQEREIQGNYNTTNYGEALDKFGETDRISRNHFDDEER